MKEIIRSEVTINHTWDLTTIYESNEAWYQEYENLKKTIKEYKKWENHLFDSAKTFLEALQEDNHIERVLEKLHRYAHLSFDVDTSNNYYQEMQQKIINLGQEYGIISSFLVPTMMQHSYEEIKQFYLEEPKLQEYAFLLENLYRYQKHTLSKQEEKLLSAFSNICSKSEDIFGFLTDSDLEFGTILDENGNEVVLTESTYSSLIKSKDRTVRKEAFTRLFQTYAQYKNTFASTLSGTVEANAVVAKLKQYPSSLEAALYADHISTEVYNNLIETVHEGLPILYEYYQFKKEVLGLKDFAWYDIYTDIIPNVKTEYTFEEAKQLVLNALSILGDDYITQVNKAFQERWIDIYPNKGKRHGAYSSGGYDTNPYLLLNFVGTLHDVSTLAHELGHSIHTYYSVKNNPYQYYHYRIFVAEVASTVNELLLNDYLYHHTNNKEEKLSILNDRLELFKATIFRQTMFAEFEKKIYEAQERGEILTSDKLSNLYMELNQLYFGDVVALDPLVQFEWARIPHFYYDFYVYKYATGLSAACHIVKGILEKKEGAVESYLKFLSLGGSMHPLDELKVAHVDLEKKEVVQSAIKMFEETLNEIKKLYEK